MQAREKELRDSQSSEGSKFTSDGTFRINGDDKGASPNGATAS